MKRKHPINYKTHFAFKLSDRDAKMLAIYAKQNDLKPLSALKKILRETLEKEFENMSDLTPENQLDLFDPVQMNIFDEILRK